MEPDAVSKKALEKAGERKAGETFDQTLQRVENVLDRRNKAMEKIGDYQKKNGTPTKEEVDDNFLKNEDGIDVTMDELKKFAVE